MTNVEELKEEIFTFIKEKRESIRDEADELSAPFVRTLADPENEEDEKIAQTEMDKILADRDECDNLLDKIENYLENQ